MNASVRLSHEAHSFEPVKKVLLEKQVRCVSVDDVLLTLYKMTSLVAASILQFR